MRARRRRRPLPPAHPRSRGEHTGPVGGVTVRVGSSPLARGTLGNNAKPQTRDRLIPARAGNIGASYPTRGRRAAHPRSRGEHRLHRGHPPASHGSSPLARGTSLHILGVVVFCRLIPARAGNMSASASGPSRRPAHPRSRGEHARMRSSTRSRSGSSPLARGTY